MNKKSRSVKVGKGGGAWCKKVKYIRHDSCKWWLFMLGLGKWHLPAPLFPKGCPVTHISLAHALRLANHSLSHLPPGFFKLLVLGCVCIGCLSCCLYKGEDSAL